MPVGLPSMQVASGKSIQFHSPGGASGSGSPSYIGSGSSGMSDGGSAVVSVSSVVVVVVSLLPSADPLSPPELVSVPLSVPRVSPAGGPSSPHASARVRVEQVRATSRQVMARWYFRTARQSPH